jgi:membrane-associated phospholipid phosphatase
MSDMGSPAKTRRSRRWMVGLVFAGIAATFALYLLLNAPPPSWRWPAFDAVDSATGPVAHQAFVLKSWLDAGIPLVPLMAIPYLSALVIVPLAVPLLSLRAGLDRGFLTVGTALIASQLLVALGSFLFPSTVLRDADPGSGLGGFLLRAIWSNDRPFSTFPSGHCAWATVAILSLWRLRRRYPRTAWALILWLLLVYPATVMLQQHYLIDVYAGILVGFSSYWGCMLLVERPRLVPGDEEPRAARHGGAG